MARSKREEDRQFNRDMGFQPMRCAKEVKDSFDHQHLSAASMGWKPMSRSNVLAERKHEADKQLTRNMGLRPMPDAKEVKEMFDRQHLSAARMGWKPISRTSALGE